MEESKKVEPPKKEVKKDKKVKETEKKVITSNSSDQNQNFTMF